MSGWLPEGAEGWQGRPVARWVADAAERRRAVLTGTVRAVVVNLRHPGAGHLQNPGPGHLHPVSHGSAVDARLDDGTGTITLRWFGREAIAGVVTGAKLHVEGTVVREGSRLCILNPLYRFVAPDPASEAVGGRAGEPSRELARVPQRQKESSTS